jgi:hypothetical protein
MRFSYAKLKTDARTNVRPSFSSLIALTLLFSGCRARNEEPPGRPKHVRRFNGAALMFAATIGAQGYIFRQPNQLIVQHEISTGL